MIPKVIIKEIKRNIGLMAEIWAATYANQHRVEQARPSKGMRSFYPLETPSWALLKILVKPEHRAILVEFVRRYDRELLLKSAVSTVMKKHEEELYTHFEEVSDFAYYMQAVQHEDDFSTYLEEYAPEENLPQKNYSDFVTLTKALSKCAATMKDPSAYAIKALYDKGVITAEQGVDFVESAFGVMHAGISSNKKATKYYKEILSKVYEEAITPLRALRLELLLSPPVAPTQALCIHSPQALLSPSPGLPNATNASPVNAPVSPYIPTKTYTQ